MLHKDAPPASDIGRNANVVIAVVVAGAALYWLRGPRSEKRLPR